MDVSTDYGLKTFEDGQGRHARVIGPDGSQGDHGDVMHHVWTSGVSPTRLPNGYVGKHRADDTEYVTREGRFTSFAVAEAHFNATGSAL